MRAIKREKMEVKVLKRLENMIAASEPEVQELNDPSQKNKDEKKKTENAKETVATVEMTEENDSNSSSSGMIFMMAQGITYNKCYVSLFLRQKMTWKWKERKLVLQQRRGRDLVK